jgi:hypothetical protein
MAIFVNAPITDAGGVEDLTAYTPSVGAAYVNSSVGSNVSFAHIAAGPIGDIRFLSGTSLGAFATTAPSADHTAELDLAFNAPNVGDSFGLTIRTDLAANTFYYLQVRVTAWDGTTATVSLDCFRCVTGTFNQIGSSANGIMMTGGTFYTVVFTVAGTTLSASLNGTTPTFGTDANIAGPGQVGIRSNLSSNTVQYKNFIGHTGALALMTVAPTTASINKTGIAFTLTGIGTSWTSGTTASLSGGTGASIVGQSVNVGAQTISGTFNAGSTIGTLTWANSTDAATATTTLNVAADEGTALYSPGTWNVASGKAISINPGSYFRRLFTGTACSALFDVTNNTGTFPTFWACIDNTKWTKYTIAASVDLTNGTPLASQLHSLEVDFSAVDYTQNRYNAPPVAAMAHTGFSLSAGAKTVLPSAKPYKVLVLGDSITEGDLSVTNTNPTGNEALGGFAWNLSKELNAEVGVVGFAAHGFTAVGTGNVPVVGTSYAFLYQGVARVLTGYDLVIIAEGANDSGSLGSITAAAQGLWTALLAAGVPKILQLGTLSFPTVDAVLSAAVTSFANSNVLYQATSGYGYTNTTGYDTAGGTHPFASWASFVYAPKLAASIKTLGLLGGSSGTTISSGGFNGGFNS